MLENEFDIPQAELMDTNLIIPTLREPLHSMECAKCGAIYLSCDSGLVGLCPDCE